MGTRFDRDQAVSHSLKRHAVDFNNILIGSDQPERLVEYYTKLFGPPTYSDDSYTTHGDG